MIEIKRIKPATKMNRRVNSIDTEKEIAHDYFNSDISVAEIAEKYKKRPKQIQGILQQWEPVKSKVVEPKEIPEDKLLIIDSRDYEFALFLLSEYGTRYREPENFTYRENFNSKIGAE